MNAALGNPAQRQLAEYLDDVAAALLGPRRRRREVLEELRDGLDLAVAKQLARGVPAETAVSTTITEFGHPAQVAEAFAPELATVQARRVLGWLVATGPLVGIFWLLLLQPQPWRTGLSSLLVAIPVLPLIAVAVATAASAFATTGRLMRWLPEAGPHRALAATMLVVALTVMSDAFIINFAAWTGRLTSLIAVVAVGASSFRILCGLLVLSRTARLRRRLR